MGPKRRSTLRRTLRLIAISVLAVLVAPAHAATLNVGPGQTYTTIQAGINAANNGDTVLVAPGTYYENIDFKGKAITVSSSGGASTTVIDGGGTPGRATVSFQTGELRDSILSSFTIRNGGYATSASLEEGGVFVLAASPSITNNIITGNVCEGVYVQAGAPLVLNNEISHSSPPTVLPNYCSFPDGFGVVLSDVSAAMGAPQLSIVGNTIENNTCAGCGGILNWGEGDLIEGNTIRNNQGTAIESFNGKNITVVQNLIYSNNSNVGTYGGGIYMSAPNEGTPVGSPIGVIAGNTLVGNINPPGIYGGATPTTQVRLEGDLFRVAFYNNLIVGGGPGTFAISCSDSSFPGSTPLLFDHNDVYAAQGTAYGGTCSDQTGSNGNLNADPLFANPALSNYTLSPGSPAIDAGNNSAPSLPTVDLSGATRIQDGGKGCIVDMGVYEYPGLANACSSTTETLVSSLNPSTYGQSVTFTAQLSSANGVPTGDVQFNDGSTVLATQTISTAGASTYTTSALAIGSHAIVASYQPTGVFSATTASLTQVVNGYATSTSLTCVPNPATVFGIEDLYATVTSPSGTPTGVINYTDGGAFIGQVVMVNGMAEISVTLKTAGVHTITATYVPTGSFAPSSATCAATVTALPTTSTLTVTPLNSTYGTPVTLAATVVPTTPIAGQAPTGTVSFFYQATNQALAALLGTVPLSASGTAALNLTNLQGGTGVFTCTYSGDSAFASSSCTGVNDTVAAAPTNLTLTSSLNPAPALTAITFTAHLTANNQPAPTGSAISLSLNNQAIVLTTDANGNAAYTTSSLVAGSYPVSAAFAGNPNLQASSAALTQVVNLIATTTTLTAAPNPAYLGQTVTLSAIVAGPSTPTGSVTFLDNGAALGTALLNAAGQATLTTTTLALGTHPLTAVYAAGTVFSGSTSSTVPEVILASSFAIALSPTAISIPAGQSKTVAIQLTSLGIFAGPLALTYGPLPRYATAAIAPTPVTLTAGGTGSSTLTLNTMQHAELATPPRPGSRWPQTLVASALLLLPLLASRRRRLAQILGALLLVASLQTLSGCTNAYYQNELVAPGTYAVTVTATDVHGNTQSATVTVAITP